MWAVYTKENKANNYSRKSHDTLCGNEGDKKRSGYNAGIWQVPKKHPTQDLWAILIPPEAIIPDNGDATIVINLPSDWWPSQTI